MPQLNTLAIDIAPSNDFSSVQSGATSSSKNSNKDFSQVIEQHYQSQQSGKKQETSGNKAKLDTEVPAEKESVREKSSTTTDVQSKEREIGTVSDEEINADTQENPETNKLLSNDQGNNEKAGQIENSKKEPVEDNGKVLVNATNESTSSKDITDSTEKLMSLLSASQKILNENVKNESAIKIENNEKLPLPDSGTKQKEATELDILLKQVLGRSNKDQADKTEDKSPQIKADKTEDNSPQIKADKSLKEEVKPQATIANETTVKKVESISKPSLESEEVIKNGSKLDLSALLDKKVENETVSNIKATDVKSQMPIQEGQIGQESHKKELTKTTKIDVAHKAEQVVDQSNNTTKTQMSASDLEALLVDVEKTTIEPELEKIKADLLGNQEKNITPDKGTQNNIKADSPVAKNVTGTELPSTVLTENVVSRNDANIEFDNVNTDKVAFAGVNVPNEKQVQENSQIQSRVINQATHKVLEPQTSNTGEQFKDQAKEQSLDQQNQKQAQSLANTEKLANNEVQVKEKSFSELFDKKLVSASVENTLNRDIHRVNEATKSATSAEEMITKLTSENVQSTAQSVTNAKQVTSLQNEALSVYRKDFTGALKDKVMVMMNQKLQQVEIRLDPQELGNVNVKINLQNEQAVVSFTVQNQQAKEAFDQNLGRLKDMLAESGVDVGDANVEQQNKQNDDEALGDGRQGGEGDVAGNELSELSDTQTLNLVKGSSTGVDYYA
jgi:flagellar hook-length control protein FliK